MLKPFVPPAVCVSLYLCISVDRFLDGLIHRDAGEWILVTKLDTETILHELLLLVHLWVVSGET